MIQTYCDSLLNPAFVLNTRRELLAVNEALRGHPLLGQQKQDLIQQAGQLTNGNQDRLFITLGHQHFVLSSFPMQDNQWLIQVVSARHSPLAQRYQKLLTAIDRLSDALIICDPYNNIELINENLSKLFPQIDCSLYIGKPLQQFILKALPFCVSVSDKPIQPLYRWLRRKITRQREVDFNFKTLDGKFISYRDRVTEQGERIGLLLDESAHHRLNEQLERARDEALDLSHAKSTFMAAMSHEVKTPLNAIIGLIDLCLTDPLLQHNDYLLRAQRSAAHLLMLINDVLDHTKFEAESVELSPQPTRIRQLCEALIEEFAGQSRQKGAQMRLYVDPCVPQTTSTDDVRLMQVLRNLISNALKFNTGRTPQVSLTVMPAQGHGRFRFAVTDNGIGINEGQQRHIFEMFTQATNDTHRQFGGSGLGLSICKNICTLMGAELSVESQEGQGACFYFTLTLSTKHGTDAQQLQPITGPALRLLTNDTFLLADIRAYAEVLNASCEAVKVIPEQLAPDQYLLLHDIDVARVAHLPPQQVALLTENLSLVNNQSQLYLQRTPLAFFKLAAWLRRYQQDDSLVAAPAHTPTDHGPLRALVVEDNEDNMFVLRHQFSALGARACFAMTPEDALIYFEQQDFDMVLSDYQMPSLSGAQLIRRLREMEAAQQRPPCNMLILTADKTQQCQDECNQAGADRILAKPLTLAVLQKLANSCRQSMPQSLAPAGGCENDDEVDDDFIFDVGNHNNGIMGARDDRYGDLSIEQLHQCIGEVNDTELQDFVGHYRHSLKQQQTGMQDALSRENWPELARLAHSLKSSALIVGADRLSDSSEFLEHLCLNSPESKAILNQHKLVNTQMEQQLRSISRLLEDLHDN